MKGKLRNDLIIKSRIDLDFSQKDLSEDTGVSINTIKSIETGRVIGSVSNLKKICDALELNIDEIYFPDFRNTRVISMVQNKGGDGKTSVCGSLAYSLSEIPGKDIRILLIDANPQINLTRSYGMDKSSTLNLGVAIEKDDDIEKYIQPTKYKNIDIVVAHPSMSAMEMQFLTKIERDFCFRNILRGIVEKGIYDYIFVDTDNHLGMMNYNILNASDYIVIPVTFAAFSLDGLEALLKHVRLVQRTNSKLKIAGIVVNKFDRRKKIKNQECEKAIQEVFQEAKMFKTKIGLDSTIENAQFLNEPVQLTYRSSRIAKEYKELAKEVLKVVE